MATLTGLDKNGNHKFNFDSSCKKKVCKQYT